MHATEPPSSPEVLSKWCSKTPVAPSQSLAGQESARDAVDDEDIGALAGTKGLEQKPPLVHSDVTTTARASHDKKTTSGLL